MHSQSVVFVATSRMFRLREEAEEKVNEFKREKKKQVIEDQFHRG